MNKGEITYILIKQYELGESAYKYIYILHNVKEIFANKFNCKTTIINISQQI